MRIRRFAFAAVAAVIALGAAGAEAQDKLRLGTEGAYPPFNFYDASGQVTGFDVEIGQALCAKMGIQGQVVWRYRPERQFPTGYVRTSDPRRRCRTGRYDAIAFDRKCHGRRRSQGLLQPLEHEIGMQALVRFPVRDDARSVDFRLAQHRLGIDGQWIA